MVKPRKEIRWPIKLIDSFKSQIGFNVSLDSKAINNGTEGIHKSINAAKSKFDVKSIPDFMASAWNKR
jgi:hypothetical protein